ncbi:hypothetical protein L3Q82_004302 [Scortum barcoo]|uniref:Uncharacterized protein n=1 Tax=Scortum barcoo TaxID=214431 RepID=A0ACB8VJM5_9TELE|nr:hypothetical protein L3Q82_004302 [Scortum barcoo]
MRAELKCLAYIGFSEDAETFMYWGVNGTYPEEDKELNEYWNFTHKDGRVYALSVLSISKVSRRFLNVPIECHVMSLDGIEVGTVWLREADHNDFYTSVSLCLAASMMILTLMACFFFFRVDLVLAYRKLQRHFTKQQAPDGKLYDAYVSFLHPDPLSSAETASFALQILPGELETKHGFSLYIRGRDDCPGEAVHDAIAATVSQCRRLIIILSSVVKSSADGKTEEEEALLYINQLGYEHKVGLHDALTQNSPRVILVEIGGPVDYSILPESLRYIKRKQGVLKWKKPSPKSHKLTRLWSNINFWKNLSKMDTSRIVFLFFMVIPTCSETVEPNCMDNERTLCKLVEGEALYFVHMNLDDTNVTQKNFTWYKTDPNFEYISTDENDNVHYHGGSLLFLNVLPENAGFYTGRYTDPSGECENFHLEVKVFKFRNNTELFYGSVDHADQNKEIQRVAYRTPVVVSPSKNNKGQFADEGLGIKLNCSVFCGTNLKKVCQAIWRLPFDQTDGYKQDTKYDSKSGLSTAILTIDKVSAQDFKAEFKCIGDGFYKEVKETLTLKRRESIVPLLSGGLTVFFLCVLAAGLVKYFAIDLALFIRPYFPQSSHNKDVRVYDAYVVYQTHDLDKATEDTLCQFITKSLPSVLEEKCGYRLFIHGRDDIPGEDLLELVEARMKQSRRLMVILSPGSGSESDITDQDPTWPQNSVIGGFDWQLPIVRQRQTLPAESLHSLAVKVNAPRSLLPQSPQKSNQATLVSPSSFTPRTSQRAVNHRQ